MPKITVTQKNLNIPAPKFWRKIENALLIILIPSIVLVLTNWGFTDEEQLNRILLLVNVLLTAVVKAIGLILAEDPENDKK